MRGVVEIWRGDELILEEPNMLVDGAGELLADIMTASPSLSGIQDTPTSSILDASNYRIQAISFGTGKDAFKSNAHSLDSEGSTLSRLLLLRTAVLNGSLGMIAVNSFPNDPGAGFPPIIGLPDSPNPAMTVLEEDTSVSSSLARTSDGSALPVSAVTPGNGQLTNFIPSAIYSSVYDATIFDDSTSACLAASLMGAFPDGSSTYGATPRLYFRKYHSGDANETEVITDGGFFNEVSSMDLSGFVNMVMSSVPNGGANGLNFSGGASGLCLSAPAEETNQGFPFVEYTVSLAAGDCVFAHAYGGITHLGLWTIDMKQSLMNGNTPPFAFSVLNNPRKYRLFCRKALSKDLTHITDVDEYDDLTIKWRIHFR